MSAMAINYMWTHEIANNQRTHYNTHQEKQKQDYYIITIN